MQHEPSESLPVSSTGNPSGKLHSAWLAAAQAGDAEAFDRLVRPLLGNLLALCRRLSKGDAAAEELLQEGLIRAHRGLAGFRAESSFRSWLMSILYRLASAPERLGPRRLPGQVAVSDEIPDGLASDPLERVSSRDTLRRVEEAMERLPVRQRTALHLRAVEGWGYDEISRVLDTSRGAVRNSVLDARRRLRERLGDLL